MTKRVSYPSDDTTVSNYAWTKSRSAYHYDSGKNDYRFDAVVGLGRFSGEWATAVETTINNSTPHSMPDKSMFKYDYERATGQVNNPHVTFNTCFKFEPQFQKMIDSFALDPMLARINVQLTGQTCFSHVDAVDLYHDGLLNNYDQDQQKQIFIMLTDYQAGHFLQMGNKIITHWRAGDFFTFAHGHVPHQTANASWYPRVMIQLTGIETAATERFLKLARYQKTVPI